MIFVSHSTANDYFVNQLSDELQIRGYQTWVDHRDMPAGSRWVAQLESALMESEVMLLVISEASIASSYVESEWHTFFNLGRKIIPLRLDDCAVPLFLRTFHQIDFRGDADFSQQIEALLHVLPLSPSQTTDAEAVKAQEISNVSSANSLAKQSEILRLAQDLIDTKALTLRDDTIQFILPIDAVILQYPLANEILIGRSHQTVKFQPDLDLNPYNHSAMVSRRHASLLRDGDLLYIRDLESSNGTFIGDKALTPLEYYPINSHSLIYFSHHFPIVIRYQF